MRSTILVLGLTLLPLTAHAIDRHEAIQIKAKQVNGRPGFRLKLVARPESYTRVRVGLGKMAAPEGSTSDQKRALAAGDQPGYLRVMLGEDATLVQNTPKELKFELAYGDNNDLKPGDKVDVVTAWGGNGYWHVYGMYDGPVNQKDEASVVTLP